MQSTFPIPVLDVPRVELPGVDRDAVAELHEEIGYSQRLRWAFSLAMHRTRKHVYGNTVPAATKATRRRRNKAARIARRAAR